MDLTPIGKVNSFSPEALIVGVKKDGTVDIVICLKSEVSKSLLAFNYARTFSIKETDASDFEKYKNKE